MKKEKLKTYCHYGHEVTSPCRCSLYVPDYSMSKKCVYLKTYRGKVGHMFKKVIEKIDKFSEALCTGSGQGRD